MIRDIRQTPKARGSERVYMPGEWNGSGGREALVRGIPLPEDVAMNLRGLAEHLASRPAGCRTRTDLPYHWRRG